MTRISRLAVGAALLLAIRAAADPPAPPPTSPIVAALNQTLRWYRQQQAEAELASDPSDVVYAEAARRQSREILRLAFDWARAAAALQPGGGASAGSTSAPATGPQALTRRASDAARAADAAQARLSALERRRAGATGRAAALLARQVAEAQGALALANARRDTLRTLADFAAQEGAGGAGGLLGQIAELQQSVPELSTRGSAPAAGATAPETLRRAAPSGIVALVAEAFTLGRKLTALHDGATLTADLRGAFDKLRAPLLADARATLQQGDALSAAPATTDAAALQARTQELSRLTSRFQQLSAALVPLGKAVVLLRTQEATLAEWRGAVDAQDDAIVRSLLLRLGLLAAAIAVVLVASAFWRAATFRYVHDLRRRQQSLLVRRIVVGALLVMMVAFSFVTELGSIATFAGFITAGLAVALQNVILSVVAYFFLIGKYGVRIGDRVQISGVRGDVIDIGLVRLHLLEVGADGLRTGRVVAFSNAVLFQPTSDFFKQIPGSNFAWHEIKLTLSPDTDYRYAESRIVQAVGEVYRQYEPRIAQQHERMSHNLSVAVDQPRPHTQLRLAEQGLEMTIRFPVPLERAADVDDRMTRALVEAIGREPRLKLAGSGTPTLQAVPASAPAPT